MESPCEGPEPVLVSPVVPWVERTFREACGGRDHLLGVEALGVRSAAAGALFRAEIR